jgi:hypothetical protein
MRPNFWHGVALGAVVVILLWYFNPGGVVCNTKAGLTSVGLL